MDEIYRKTHDVSHSQIDLVASGAELAEMECGGTLVSFAPGHIKIATAWDENGTVEPHVELIVTGFNLLAAIEVPAGMTAVASGPFVLTQDGAEAGNYITGDIAQFSLPKATYVATVFVDKLEPMTARRVHVHLRRA
jgi:hypothetical protein